MLSGTVVPTQPAWSPLVIDPVVAPGTPPPNGVYAQPLWVKAISTSLPACNPCNMLVVATLGGGLYAFNGGDGTSNSGALIWSRNAQTSGGANTTNYFWYDDCGLAGSVSYPPNISPYTAGLLATPVIDRHPSPPVLYATSACDTTSGVATTQQWYIHEINLLNGHDVVTSQAQRQIKGTAPSSDGADDATTGSPCPSGQTCIPFNPIEVIQRPALLKVVVPGTSPNPLIYVAFGWGSPYEKNDAFHGWIFGYDSLLNQQFAFVTTAKGTTLNTDFPACTSGCSACSPYTSGSSVGCTLGGGCVPAPYVEQANWCGHAGGVWMSGRGGAASTDSNGVSHAYFGIGNGAFQQNAVSSTGALLNPIENWGNTIVDFTFSTGGLGTAPSEYFTPYGFGTSPTTVQDPLGSSLYTYQGMNQNDLDLGTSGILLFDDLAGTPRAVTIDKAGYGYLLTQGNLCGSTGTSPTCYPGASAGSPGFAANDPGNVFPFIANQYPCINGSLPILCDRTTSMAFYPDGSPERLFFWPNTGDSTKPEALTSLALSGNLPITHAGATIGSSGTTVCGSGTTFTQWVIPGDTLTDTGSANPGQSRIVTSVVSDTQLQIGQAFTSNIGSYSGSCPCSSTPDTLSYNGYFVNPMYDTHPSDGVEYPGGTVAVTSNGGTDAVAWGLANMVGVNGTLLAYDAASLHLLWCSSALYSCDSSSAFKTSLFAVPTIVNGYAYVPTSGITKVPSTSHAYATCTSSAPCYGVLVYSGH